MNTIGRWVSLLCMTCLVSVWAAAAYAQTNGASVSKSKSDYAAYINCVTRYARLYSNTNAQAADIADAGLQMCRPLLSKLFDEPPFSSLGKDDKHYQETAFRSYARGEALMQILDDRYPGRLPKK
ncbi:hypothetical protein ACYJW8_13295 [Frateuria aurantia]